jgi:ELP3 family radical SAM enzyme/protein acetyltransferase
MNTQVITDIEDYIKTIDKVGKANYNTINVRDFDFEKCKNIFLNLLIWIHKESNKGSSDSVKKEARLNYVDSAMLKKGFAIEYNRMIRFSKIPNLKKSVLINILNTLIEKTDFEEKYHQYFDIMKLLLRKKPSRNISGITSVTVITAPFPNGQTFSCSHNCYYCPNEPAHEENNWQAQPRSYLYWEPAVQRANRWKFNAVSQMLDRMDSYLNNGHVIDKLEIIVEGGTYTEYPVDYLEEYHRDIFYAANIYFDLRRIFPGRIEGYGQHLADYIRPPGDIAREMLLNKAAKVHIIGICIETRPDAIDDDWLRRFRLWGVTRIQLGIQHVDNKILKKINRGHTIEQGLWAIRYLKDNCFKIDIHIMPDLPGSNPEKDKEMFDYVYSVVCPDQMKVYPCEVVPWTVIEKWYKSGKYVPYFDKNPEDLIDVVRYSMETCPNWIRLPRVIRDIPGSYIQCGTNITNLRQIIDDKLDCEGVTSNDIRFREIGRDRNIKYYNLPGGYNIYYYYANNGHDYFIAYESQDLKALFGFIRLRILEDDKNRLMNKVMSWVRSWVRSCHDDDDDGKNNLTVFNSLKGCGLVRELHVYGDTTAVNTCGAQHKGIGKQLLKIAERITMEQGLYQIAVISGEGVKGYYERMRYKDIDTFMIKKFWRLQVWYHVLKNLRLIKYIWQYLGCGMGWYLGWYLAMYKP